MAIVLRSAFITTVDLVTLAVLWIMNCNKQVRKAGDKILSVNQHVFFEDDTIQSKSL